MSVRFHDSRPTCLIARNGQTHVQFRAAAKMIMSDHLLAAIQKMELSELLVLVSAVHPHKPAIHREHKVVLSMVVDNLWEAAESLFKLRGIGGVTHLLHLVIQEGLNTAVNVVALRQLVGEMKGRRSSSTKIARGSNRTPDIRSNGKSWSAYTVRTGNGCSQSAD